MGASIISGNVKYVFTQAVAPNNEGEVAGSLWYKTGDKDLYTYDGTSWNKVSPTDNEGWIVIERGTLASASHIDIISITASKYKIFKLVVTGNINNATGSDHPYFRLNGDTTATNYSWIRWDFSTAGTSVITTTEDTSDSAMYFSNIEDNTHQQVFEVLISNRDSKYKCATMTNSCQEFRSTGYGYWKSTNEINQITLSVAGSFEAGTEYVLLGLEET